MESNPPTSQLDAARQTLGLTVDQLWVDYFALGGALSKAHVVAVLKGEQDLRDGEYNVLAQALNERFIDQEQNHPVPYRGEDRSLPEL
jgi:hypothetical protein